MLSEACAFVRHAAVFSPAELAANTSNWNERKLNDVENVLDLHRRHSEEDENKNRPSTKTAMLMAKATVGGSDSKSD